MATPKQTDPQFKLRFTPELRDQIEAAAKANTRTMNSEIIARLEESFTFPQTEYRLRAEIAEMNQVTEGLHQEILEFQDQIKRQKEREIDNLAEIKRLRTELQEVRSLRDELKEARREVAFMRGVNSAISFQNNSLFKYWVDQPGADKDVLDAILHELQNPRPVPDDPLFPLTDENEK